MKTINKSCIFPIALAMLSCAATIQAATTMAYWRMGDDDNNPLLDSSGNGHNFYAAAYTAYPLPASGRGSTFPSPIPQNDLTNEHAVSLDGSSGGDRMVANNFMDSSLDFSVEGFINLGATNTRTQYIISKSNSAGNNRGWAIGVAASTGTGTAGPNELFFIASANGSSAVVVPLGLQLTVSNDYYFGMSYNNATSTNDIVFYYEDLTGAGSLQTNIVSSGVVTLNNPAIDLEVGATNSDQNNYNGLVDELRISSGLITESELLVVTPIPEPTAISMIAMVGLVGILIKRKRIRLA